MTARPILLISFRQILLMFSIVFLLAQTGRISLAKMVTTSQKDCELFISGALDDHYNSKGQYVIAVTVDGLSIPPQPAPFSHGRPHGKRFSNWSDLVIPLPRQLLGDGLLKVTVSHTGSSKRDWLAVDSIRLECSGLSMTRELGGFKNYGARDGAAAIIYGGRSLSWEISIRDILPVPSSFDQPVGESQSREAAEWPLSFDQKELIKAYSFPDTFTITYAWDERQNPSIPLRVEIWKYASRNVAFTFIDGKLSGYDRHKAPQDVKSYPPYRPQQFSAGMTLQQLSALVGATPLTGGRLNPNVLEDAEVFVYEHGLTVGFHKGKCCYVSTVPLAR